MRFFFGAPFSWPQSSGEELVFYCDCNNNTIDKVSGLRMFEDIHSSATVYTPSFVVDPADSTRYCIKKPNGAPGMSAGTGIVPVIIGDYTARSNPNGRYVIANSTASGYSNESNRFWLASPTYGNHKVEFYWYCSSTASNGCIFDSSGLGNNNNSNSNNSGIALDCINGNIVIRARNNSSANLDTIVGTRSSLAGNWYKVEFYFYYVSSSSYMATVNVYNTGGTLISTVTRTLNLPLQPTKMERGCFIFLSDYSSNGQWARNIYDMIKEVKVYKLPSQ